MKRKKQHTHIHTHIHIHTHAVREAGVVSKRLARRAEQGYVAPQAAAAFLALAAKTDVHALAQSRERDAVTLAYFRDLERRPAEASPRAAHDAAAADTAAAADKGSARLLHALREAGVVEQEPAAPLSLAAPEDGAELGGEELLRAALAELRARDPIAYSARFGELAYLANVLVSGYQRGTRRLPPAQAAKLALRVVARGVAQRLGSARLDALEATVRLLRREHADRLFRIGWPLHLDDEGQHPIA